MDDSDVLVVGGGPTGMTVAGDLARMGRTVTVLERWREINPASRAFATMPRTLELLDNRGLADHLLSIGNPTPAVRLFRGAVLDLSRLSSRYPFTLITPQTNVDRALGGYAAAQGARIRRGVEAVGVEQGPDGVTVTTRPRDGGEQTTFRARYVVAADGAYSTVRGLLGAEFPGRAVLSSIVLADVRLTNGPRQGGLTLGSTPGAFGFLVPYGSEGWYRSMTWQRDHQMPDDAPVEDGEVASVLNKAMGRDVGVAEISWNSRFHCDERQVADYRHDRVFLAGDAAHVHSPMGGQGMNTGIQDAVNLAWKLDLALGGAPDRILDTYQAERHPIGRRVILQSGAMMRAITLQPRGARWLRDRLAPIALSIQRVNKLIAGSFAGTTLRYGRSRGQHALVGTRATDIPLADGRLAEVQRTPGFVLVRERGAAAAGTALVQAERTDVGPALLVRPDGYVAWAGSTSDGLEHGGGWHAALTSWTGG